MNKKGLSFARLTGIWPINRISESIRYKLLFWFLALSIIPILILGGIAYKRSKEALVAQAFDNLKALEGNKSNAIRTYFEERYGDMNAMVETVKTLRSKAFNQLASIQQLKKNLIESYFNERVNDVKVISGIPLMGRMLESFERVSGAVGGPNWKEIEQLYGHFLVKYAESYLYYDIYLVSASGEILYTVAKLDDLGKNLMTSELKDSPAGKAFQGGLTQLTFQDFDLYDPAGGMPAAFIAAPIQVKGEVRGVLMVQISVDQINYVMQERTGLGQSGESYLVGPEGLFRSDSFHIEESTILNPAYLVDIEGGVEKALKGETGEAVSVNYRGEYVLSSWTPVKVHEKLNWAMLGEIDIIEAFIPQIEGEDKDFFAKFKEKYGYYDLGLVNPDGFLYYTVEKGEDYRTNLLTGPFKDTNLGRLVKAVMETKDFGMADYELYAPIKGNAAFIAVPVLSANGDVETIIVARLSSEQINQVMLDRTGLGKTGETYLVGSDNYFRSESLYWKDSVMKKKCNTTATRSALNGGRGTEIIKDYRDVDVLSSWSSVVVSPPSKINPKGIRWAIMAEFDRAEVMVPVNRLFWNSIVLVIVVAIVVFFVALFLSRGLTVQVNHITNLFSEIGMGNFEARTPVITRDEMGSMAYSLNAMLDNTLTLIQSSEERDAMQNSVMRLLGEISGFAEGNLTSRAEVTEDFTGAIADSFNNMAEQLGTIVRHVKEVTLQVSSTAQEVSTSTENLAESSEMQAVQVSDAIAAINEMATSIQQVAESASRCSEVSEVSKKHSKEGADTVRNTNKAMESIRDHVKETAQAIKRLGESSQEVGNIVQLISDIADRTSILALNASIQAAMAGDAGRGFAVVADEVQRLAERSTNATQQIDTLIKNIQGEINEAGTSMEESIQRVVEGSKLADNAYNKLQEIETVTVQLGEIIQSISMASKQQARASENIAKTMEEVGEISSQNSAASRQTAVSMKHLAEVSDKLNESVTIFKLEK